MGTTKKKTSVSLEEATLRKLRKIAKRDKRSVSFVVNEALEQKLLNGAAKFEGIAA